MLTLTNEQKILIDNNHQYKELNETFYNTKTDERLIKILQENYESGTRLKFYYGNPETGQLWDEPPICGYIGRSTGTIKIPLLLSNKRSYGDGSLMEHCIVKIEHSNKKTSNVNLVYKHPKLIEEAN